MESTRPVHHSALIFSRRYPARVIFTRILRRLMKDGRIFMLSATFFMSWNDIEELWLGEVDLLSAAISCFFPFGKRVNLFGASADV